jgi:alpha-D-ribose 1-methylphosphonate 5-triphosphate diphosphatase
MIAPIDLRIAGAQVLLDRGLVSTSVRIDAAGGVVSDVGTDRNSARTVDARGLFLLPGIVDIHGDAFERQMMPRPGVHVALDIALADSDRQAVANGITTVFHGVTWSWEPGLRGSENARAILSGIEQLRPRLSADTRYHLRHETFNLAAESEVCDWVESRRVGAVAFNDHLPSPDSATKRPDKIAQMVERSGIPREDFVALVQRLHGRRDEVPASISRIAAKASAHEIALLSHDDSSPEQRQWFRARGCHVSEFPVNVETARDAADSGDHIVLGAPNVMRGKSHMGWVNASEMVSLGLCSVLASDYYYPAPLIAAFRLAEQGVTSLEKAWRLVSSAPAQAAGLDDRGEIDIGKRADLLLVAHEPPQRPRIVAVIADGRIVHLTEPERLGH